MSMKNRSEEVLQNQAECFRYIVEILDVFLLITFFFLLTLCTIAMIATALQVCVTT